MKHRTLQLTDTDEDRSLLGRLDGVEIRPVFVMGLHRSGTTMLYQALADLLQVAPLTLHDIVYYRRLLRAHHEGTTGEDRARLDRFLDEQGLETRLTDRIAVSHRTVEEYGWVLRRNARSARIKPRTRSVFETLCRKLHYLHPDARALLLKNPWDIGNAARMLSFFPEARFVYISRNPVETLNSQLRAALHYGSGIDPYLALLIRGATRTERTVAIILWSRRLLGQRLFGRGAMKLIENRLARGLERYRQDLLGLPEEVRIEIGYESFIESPRETLGRIVDFLELPLRGEIVSFVPEPREQELLPEVQRRRSAFLRRLEFRNCNRREP